jgi:hypothetical protein
MNNVLIKFLQELFQRLATKSPKFFKVWQIILVIVTGLTGLPEILKWLNITLPPDLSILANKTVAIASAAALFMAALTSKEKPVGVTSGGDVIKKTDEGKLPFTHDQEKRSAARHDLKEVEVKPKNESIRQNSKQDGPKKAPVKRKITVKKPNK